MNLVRFNSLAPSKNFFDEIFNNFLDSEWDMPKSWAKFNQPLVNLIEEKDAFHIEMAIPGVHKDDVEIKLEKDQLIIKASKEENNEENSKNYARKEFYFGSFEKSFYIPETVNREAIDATFKDGILYVELKKKEEAVEKGPQHIEIK